MTIANAAALAGAIPDAKLRILDDAGHLMFIERFTEVNRAVVTFLRPRKLRKRTARPADEAEAEGAQLRSRG